MWSKQQFVKAWRPALLLFFLCVLVGSVSACRYVASSLTVSSDMSLPVYYSGVGTELDTSETINGFSVAPQWIHIHEQEVTLSSIVTGQASTSYAEITFTPPIKLELLGTTITELPMLRARTEVLSDNISGIVATFDLANTNLNAESLTFRMEIQVAYIQDENLQRPDNGVNIVDLYQVVDQPFTLTFDVPTN